MGAVFVSYRRGDSEGQARALVQTIARHVGKKSVFMDVDSIDPGRDFRQVLSEHLASCDMMLVIIGKGWLSATDATGRRRLDDPKDFVRQEVAAALKRNIPVTPVLVQGVSIPSADELPEELQDLTYRNSFELGHNRWDSDVSEMMRRLGLVKSSVGYWVGGVGVALVLGALAIVTLRQQNPTQTLADAPAVQEPSAEAAKPASTTTTSSQPSTTTTLPGPRSMGLLENATNRDGGDILPSLIVDTPQQCSDLCFNNASCEAMTFVPRVQEQDGKGNCWLKRQPGVPTLREGYVSALRRAP